MRVGVCKKKKITSIFFTSKPDMDEDDDSDDALKGLLQLDFHFT